MELKKWVRLAELVIAVELAGLLGSLFVMNSLPTWYAYLNKPSFAPPGSFIGAVWTTLYFLMGVSLFLVIDNASKKRAKERKLAIRLFWVQLALNVLWSFLFFYLESPLYGLIELIALWFAVLACILAFDKVSRKAALLLVPYIVWICVAGLLNYLILVLNP